MESNNTVLDLSDAQIDWAMEQVARDRISWEDAIDRVLAIEDYDLRMRWERDDRYADAEPTGVGMLPLADDPIYAEVR